MVCCDALVLCLIIASGNILHTILSLHKYQLTTRQDDDPKQNKKFVLSKEDAKVSSRARYTQKWKQGKLNRLMKSKNVSGIDKPESIGVLSNDMESVNVDPQDEIVLSVDVEQDQPAQSQGRRLNALTLEDFKDTCIASILSISGGTRNYTMNPEGSFINCRGGKVNGNGALCSTACNGKCCAGSDACGDAFLDDSDDGGGTIEVDGGFTGKGK